MINVECKTWPRESHFTHDEFRSILSTMSFSEASRPGTRMFLANQTRGALSFMEDESHFTHDELRKKPLQL